MKKLRNFGCIVMLTLLVNAAHAQAQWGIYGGANYNTATYKKFNGPSLTTGFVPGYNAGIIRKSNPIEDQLFLITGFTYMNKGYTVNNSGVDSVKIETSFNSFEIPLWLQFNFNTNASHAFIRFGPALTLNVSGTDKTTKANGSIVTSKMKFDFEQYAPYDASVQLHVGYETAGGFFVDLRAVQGSNFYNADAGPKIRNRNLALSIGYYFKRKNKRAFD
jgi:hypothetical protein